MAVLNRMDMTYRQWLLEALARDAERWARVEDELARIRLKQHAAAAAKEQAELPRAA